MVSSYVRLIGSSLRSDQTLVKILKGMEYKMDYAIPKQSHFLGKKQHLAVLQGAEFTGVGLELAKDMKLLWVRGLSSPEEWETFISSS